MISIRKTRKNDVEEIASLKIEVFNKINSKSYEDKVIEAFKNANSKEKINKRLDIKDSFVAIEDNKVVSIIYIKDNKISGFATKINHMNQGIGSRLLEHAEKVIKEKGYDKIILNSTLNALEFYQKRGYEIIDKKNISTINNINYNTISMKKKIK